MSDQTKIDFLRIDNDVNGKPRYVCHFLNLITEQESEDMKGEISQQYELAIKKARAIGGKKYHNKKYGGGIVFQSYNIGATQAAILKIKYPDPIKFLQDWSPEDFGFIGRAIVKHFRRTADLAGKIFIGSKLSFGKIDKELGLAYTSTSSCAMYSICNVDLRYDDKYRYVFFAIGEDGKCYAELWDKDENVKIIQL